ncbi:MAG: recombination protein RecR [Bacteroidia bacterium]|nr:MAG: recombination protein RecR [Bacteroidia bacterium]
MNLPSKLVEAAVEQFSTLPGIGKRTALRLVLHFLKQNKEDVNAFANTIVEMRNNIKYCKSCHNISDKDICEICSDNKRDHSIICVVEDVRDVMAIENTMQYRGIYHVLGGIISPMNGIGPNELNIESLVAKAASGTVNEMIFALSATMEGDTTNFYIFKRIKDYNIKSTVIARGVAIGDDLEYTDEVTLGRSILNRVPYENSFVR